MQQFNYKESHKYFNKALKVNANLKHNAKNNNAHVYMEERNYQKAIEILLSLTLEKKVLNDTELYSTVLSNLGLCYFRTCNSKALDYLNKGLKIREERGIDFEILGSYLYLAEFYLKKNPDLAFKYSLIAYEKATKIKDNNDRLISLTSLIKSSKGDESKKYALDYIRINDSNIKAKQIAKNQFAKMKYDSKNEKEENQKLKIDKIQNEILLEQQKNRVLLLFYFITTGIIATLGIVNYLNSKNKRDKVKTMIETENRISKKLHDEVANDLFQTIAFAETQDLGSNENKDLLLSNLGHIYDATRNISRENSCLLQGADFENEIKEWLKVKDEHICLDFSSDDICVMNFRGGEFVGLSATFLKPNYWQSAMNHMLDINKNMKFIVITDDVAEAFIDGKSKPPAFKSYLRNKKIEQLGL
mgnify:CR=1 FL=1